MDRWDTFSFQRRDTGLLADALKAVTGLLETIPPSAPVVPLSQANQLLLEIWDCLRSAQSGREGEEPLRGGNERLPGGGRK